MVLQEYLFPGHLVGWDNAKYHNSTLPQHHSSRVPQYSNTTVPQWQGMTKVPLSRSVGWFGRRCTPSFEHPFFKCTSHQEKSPLNSDNSGFHWTGVGITGGLLYTFENCYFLLPMCKILNCHRTKKHDRDLMENLVLARAFFVVSIKLFVNSRVLQRQLTAGANLPK